MDDLEGHIRGLKLYPTVNLMEKRGGSMGDRREEMGEKETTQEATVILQSGMGRFS